MGRNSRNFDALKVFIEEFLAFNDICTLFQLEFVIKPINSLDTFNGL